MRRILMPVTVFVFCAGCSLFRSMSEKERKWSEVERAHQEYAAARIDEMERRHAIGMRDLKDRLWRSYQRRLARVRDEINSRYDRLIKKNEKVYGEKPDLLERRVSQLNENRRLDLRQYETKETAKYEEKRQQHIAALQKRQTEEMVALKRRLEAELAQKRQRFEADWAGAGPEAVTLAGAAEEPHALTLRGAPKEKVVLVAKASGGVERVVQVDRRPALLRKKPHQAVITFFLYKEEGAGTAEPRLAVFFNGASVAGAGGWQLLHTKLLEFRRKVYETPEIHFPQVLLDQVGDVPMPYVDRIEEACFEAGIWDVAPAGVINTAP